MRHLLFLFFLLPLVAKEAAPEKLKAAPQRAQDSLVQEMNSQLSLLRATLEERYAEVEELYGRGAEDEAYTVLLREINQLREEILRKEEDWRIAAVNEMKRDEEGYALWDQEETTLAQLIMEYGAPDFLYIIPPEMAALKLNLHSAIPIPRESWKEMVEIILQHNGIGIKKLNTFVRQLFVLKQDLSAVRTIATDPQDLMRVPAHSRVFYIFTPQIEQLKNVLQFFERFTDARHTFVYQVGPKIALVAGKEEVERLLSLYDAIWGGGKGRIARVISLSKIGVKEMEKILTSFFGDLARPALVRGEESLSILPLLTGRSIILVGPQPMVDRAEKLVKDTEEQLHDPSEMTVFLYRCRHSDPSELSKVLDKVYNSLLYTPSEGDNYEVNYALHAPPSLRAPDGYAPAPMGTANPTLPAKPTLTSHVEVEREGSDHFIPDPKTGTILMVVRRDVLAKVKELVHRLDIPKKMVQIEVLLFEKRIANHNSFGINLLRLGTEKGSHVEYSSHQAVNGPGIGVTDFFFKKGHTGHFPPVDLRYNFLMTQDDIRLNAAPSIIAINQTPATIAITEEISINNGAAPIDTNKGIAFEKSFTRAQYGITIVLTPTVHAPADDEEKGRWFVTMKTDITFDSVKPMSEDRPLVDKRHIQNEVRVVDGQTVILGGLRRKSSMDKEDKIPLLGEIPGLGKIFGSTNLIDNNTEMFFFITPRVILDPKEELEQIKIEEMRKRPGDLPEFLSRLVEARDKERKHYFEQSFKLFFDK